MRSAGNDIVSLEEINVSRTITQQFYSKILSAAEVALYEKLVPAVIPFEKYVWLLWSIKEAAYKFLKRLDPALVFTPVKFEVTQIDIPKGYSIAVFNTEIVETGFGDTSTLKSVVEVGGYTVYVNSIIYTKFISSVANSEANFDTVFWGIRKIDFTDNMYQSEEVRRFLYRQVSEVTGIKEVTINKDPNGIPLLSDSKKELMIPVSLAHHGHYIGYSFKLQY